MVEVKIGQTGGRDITTEPGVSIRISGPKLSNKDLRDELGAELMKILPKLVTKVMKEQTEMDSFLDPKKKKEGN